MSDYYFDIETYSRTAKPNFNNDEIIAITYQQIVDCTLIIGQKGLGVSGRIPPFYSVS